MMLARRIALASLVALLARAEHVQAQDLLASARGLYAAAEYDEALKVLDELGPRTASDRELQSIELYRTLCLLAVGRRNDADRSMEAMIARDPLYRPGDELSPRTRTAFSDAKKRVLPAIAQQHYAQAKAAFERNEFENAAVAFKGVVDALNDPDIAPAAMQPPLSDLRMLAAGFHDLSVKAITPPPAPPPPTPAPAPPVNIQPRIFSGDEAGVRPPVMIAQNVPKYPGPVPPSGLRGTVEVVIDEQGSVESAVMVAPVRTGSESPPRLGLVAASYDKMVLAEASKWQFAPATLNGQPVKFRKRIQINVTPATR